MPEAYPSPSSGASAKSDSKMKLSAASPASHRWAASWAMPSRVAWRAGERISSTVNSRSARRRAHQQGGHVDLAHHALRNAAVAQAIEAATTVSTQDHQVDLVRQALHDVRGLAHIHRDLG